MKKMNSVLFGIWLLVFSSHAAIGTGATFDEVVVFGDSLSDNGNLVIVEGQPLPDPTLYYQGRLSNGPVWVEYLTDPRHLGTALSDKAYGGANSSGLLPPGVIQQVTAYTVSVGSPLSADHLFAVWGGANDYLNEGEDPETVIANIEEALARLAQFGAMHILVLNLPDLGAIPDKLDTAESVGATAFSTNYNSGLAAMPDQFRMDYPDISLYTYDIFSLLQSVQNAPGSY
jgi:phospholipase/lecithinase/hemolysin